MNRHNRLAIFEPVCTHPNHQRRGWPRRSCSTLLALRRHGAQRVVVGTGDMIPANRLYESIGFTEAYREQEWRLDR
ncbi:MAG: GNAT family N-acetyltransferase [Caldilineaceae bacterium]